MSKKAEPKTEEGSKSSASGKAARKFGETEAAKSSGKGRPSGKSGRRPVTPVKVSSDKPWGTIALFGLVGLLFVSIVGYTGYQAWYNDRSLDEKVGLIDGATNYRADDSIELGREHKEGDLDYDTTPAVGGNHNGTWQNCQGDVYDEPIAEEHAVHSMEHGAVWITYQPDLPKAQVKDLAEKVRGKDYMLMSPYPELKSPISLQAWGFQLKVDSVNDPRIDDFITATRKTASIEQGAGCSNGVTVTGDKPREVAPPQQPGMPGQPGQPGAPQPGAPQPGQPGAPPPPAPGG